MAQFVRCRGKAYCIDSQNGCRTCGRSHSEIETTRSLRVLGKLTQIKKQVDKGLISFGRMYVREGLPGWFRLHAATMDSALAAHWKHHASPREPGA